MTALSDRLAQAKGDRSIDDVVARAQEQGHRIDRSAVARYLKGEHGPRPRLETLAALAAGFDLDARELRVLAGRPPGELGPYVPTSEAASLTAEQRDALDQLIKAITRSAADDRGVRRIERADDRDLSAEPPRLIEAERRVASRRQVKSGDEDVDEE
ncbi:hypothetical protein [Microlunatus parietis]|uniref:Transcriptional regulator with XRE-family HTH domain n=1 Tax=Microlunatus parietis TaxID=682979 RepID=A0A7Y9LAI2_9ACTN|nr:hypothetical protein [Microlunatus parietis]NYE69615.1 transcriptional regulator with XRE-family HTH domain [Microlunatus parietis]